MNIKQRTSRPDHHLLWKRRSNPCSVVEACAAKIRLLSPGGSSPIFVYGCEILRFETPPLSKARYNIFMPDNPPFWYGKDKDLKEHFFYGMQLESFWSSCRVIQPGNVFYIAARISRALTTHYQLHYMCMVI